MIVRTLEHGRAVIKRLIRVMGPKNRWLVFDYETKPKPGFLNNDALIPGRMQFVVQSVCYRAESYSFPTACFSPELPLGIEWLELFRPIFRDTTIVKVFHNANYDLNVIWTESSGTLALKNVWCTMIGVWKANAALEKGLKSRGPLYGRHLRKTASVDFTGEEELSRYAEEDVVATDEIYQMQRFGFIDRPKNIFYLSSFGKLVKFKNPLPFGKLKISDETLNRREKREIKLQEYPYLNATLRSEQRGFPFDSKYLRNIRKKLTVDSDLALKKVFKTAGKILNLNSGKQLAALMKDLGLQSPERTKKGAESFKANALAKMQEDHPIVGQILNYRGLKKMQSVYVGDPNSTKVEKQFGLEYFVQKDGRIRATSNPVGAVTGRTTSSNPNLTQLPSAKDTYGVKECFRAPKGFRLIVLDYAQLELRVATLFHQDKAMTKILCDPEGDLHLYTADQFGVDRDPTAKQINFLLVYGGGAYVLSEKLSSEGVPTDVHQADSLIQRYDEVYSRVRPWRQFNLEYHQAYGYIKLFTGRTRALLNVNWENRRDVHKAETTLANNQIQGSGQDFLKASIIRADPKCINPDKAILTEMKLPQSHKNIILDYSRKLEKFRKEIKLAKCTWLLQVHDESIWLCDEKAADEMLQMLAQIMTWRHYFPPITEYTVPLVVDGGYAETWKQAKSKQNKNRIRYGL